MRRDLELGWGKMNKGGSEEGAMLMGWEGRGVEVLLAIHHSGTSMIVK